MSFVRLQHNRTGWLVTNTGKKWGAVPQQSVVLHGALKTKLFPQSDHHWTTQRHVRTVPVSPTDMGARPIPSVKLDNACAHAPQTWCVTPPGTKLSKKVSGRRREGTINTMCMTYEMKKSVPLSFFLLFKMLMPSCLLWDVINQLKRRISPPSVGEVEDTFLWPIRPVFHGPSSLLLIPQRHVPYENGTIWGSLLQQRNKNLSLFCFKFIFMAISMHLPHKHKCALKPKDELQKTGEFLHNTSRNPKILLLDHSINRPVRVNYKMADEGLLPCN